MVLIFDGDCSFCSSSARLFKRLTKNRIKTEAFQLADLKELGLNIEECAEALKYERNGEIYSGHLAAAQALIDSKTAWAIAGYLMKLPVITSLSYQAYDLIARNRHRLPGGTPECQIGDR